MHFSFLRKPHLLIPIAGLAFAGTVTGDPPNRPAWWTDEATRVIALGAVENNKGPANIGQAKHMVKSALDALRPILPDVTTAIEADLMPIVDLEVEEPKTPEWLEQQKAPLLIGQLKAISAPFYTRLHEHLLLTDHSWLEDERIANQTNVPNSIFPWTSEPTEVNNKGIANIGQLKAVFSLRFETIDSDGDGIPDITEIANDTDPLSPDTDRDGIPDLLDPYPGSHANPNLAATSATYADPDGRGLVNAGLTGGLRAHWDFEGSLVLPATLFGKTEARAENKSATAPSWPVLVPFSAGGTPPTQRPGFVSAGIPLTNKSIFGDAKVFNNITNSFTLSFWHRFEKDAIKNSNGIYRCLWSLCKNRSSSNPSTLDSNILGIRKKNATQEEIYLGVYTWTSGGGHPHSTMGGISFTRPLGTTDDGGWHQFTIVRTGGKYTLLIDGLATAINQTTVTWLTIPMNLTVPTSSTDWNYDWNVFGSLSPERPQNLTGGTFDRIRLWDRPLTPAETLLLYREDTDNDGLWDITEVKTALWRDLNSNTLRDIGETTYSSHPLEWQDDDTDTDGDGLTDKYEQNVSFTDINNPDTDGDLMPDGWEIEHDLDPNDPSDAGLDPDEDGLINLHEYLNATDPREEDTDGDGTDDGDEITAEADPTDPTDGGQQRPAAERLTINLGIGDKSGSKSEDYVMHIYRIDPETGAEVRFRTVRSGGFGEYEEKTITNFLKGETYTFQIDWQQSNLATKPASGTTPAEGPDFDYTFKVEPQGTTNALLLDSYDPKSKTADTARKLLASDASNVAETQREFEERYESRRVVLLPVEVVSRDKFLAGSFSIPSSWDSLEMEFVGPDGSLGKYGNLLGGGSTKIYDKVEDIMADSDYAAGGQADTQKVWFVRDSTDARKINYYTCFDSTGDVQIKLYLNGDAEAIGEITHTLTAAEDFAAVIDYVDEWVKGTSFDFTGGVITPPLAMRGMSMNAAGGGGIHNLTRAALIPFFNVVSNVEGLGSVAFGLFDGIKEGVSDDYKLLVLIKSGVLGAGGWAIQAAEAELNKWKDDPLKRAAELKKAADRLCQEWVFKPMETVQADLSTWEGFKKRSWQTWKSVEGTANKAWVLTQSSWGSIKTGLKDWVNDFADRMMEGAEKAHWSENLLVMDKIGGDLNEVTRQASYTFGYTFGYISEQVAVGILTGGTVKVAAVMTKGGAAMATQLAARRVLPVVARLQFVKKWAASVAISIEMKVAVERGLIIAAETPLSLAVKDSAAEVIERGMKRATFERTAFSNSKVLDEVIAALSIKKLILTPGREGQFWYKFALFFEVMGDKATAPASKGWVKAYNRLLKFNGDVLESDRAGDLLALYKAESTAPGREALRKSLDDFAANANPAALHPDLKFLDIENVATKGYRYAGDVDWLAQRGWSYPAHSGGGWYCTFDDMAESLTAKGRLQLPVENSARYKIEFDTIPIKSNTYVPYGRLDNAEWFEPLARDYPDFGVGGGTQFLVKDAEIVINRVIDLSTNPPTVIFTRP